MSPKFLIDFVARVGWRGGPAPRDAPQPPAVAKSMMRPIDPCPQPSARALRSRAAGGPRVTSIRSHPEERACCSGSTNSNGVRASRRVRTARALMLRDAAPQRVEDLRARTEGAAPQHEGRTERVSGQTKRARHSLAIAQASCTVSIRSRLRATLGHA